jgi:hypothetical protein
MGWTPMSECDMKRIEVLSEVLAGRRTVAAGAAVLAISERQAYRCWRATKPAVAPS